MKSGIQSLPAMSALAAFFLQSVTPSAPAQSPATGVPQLLHYQGRVTVGGVNHDGPGYFKFALVDSGANQNRTATATCTISSNGRVTGATVTSGGRGYTDDVPVSFTGTGTGATAEAKVS